MLAVAIVGACLLSLTVLSAIKNQDEHSIRMLAIGIGVWLIFMLALHVSR